MNWLKIFSKRETTSPQKISLNSLPSVEGMRRPVEQSTVPPRGKSMDIRRVRTCEQCKTVVPLEKVRLYPKEKGKEGNRLLCVTCCDALKQTIKQGPPKAPIKNISPAQPKIYRCNRCNYSFRVDLAKVGILHRLSCPYCGKDDRLEK